MNHRTRTIAGLALAIGFYFSLPASLMAASPEHSATVTVVSILSILAFVGATTVLYTFPNAGTQTGLPGITAFNGATAPTAAQAAPIASLSIKFQMTDSETSCTFTHNWNLSGTETNQFFPIPIIQGFANLGTAGGNSFSVAYGANTVVVSKGNTAGSAGTFTCVLLKPHTLIR